MFYLYLVRHPHAQVDPNRPPQEWRTSDDGRLQLHTLAQAPFWPHLAALYSSPEPKALHVAAAIATRYNIPLMVSKNLAEVDRAGKIYPSEQKYEASLKKFFAKPHSSVDGWETAESALARFCQGVDQIKAAYRNKPVAVLSHGTVLTLYTAMLENVAPSLERWRGIEYASIATVDLQTNRIICPFVVEPYQRIPVR